MTRKRKVPPNVRLRSWLEDRGLVARDLAERLGVTRQTVTAWLTGKNPRPGSVSELHAIERFTSGPGCIRASDWLKPGETIPPPIIPYAEEQ